MNACNGILKSTNGEYKCCANPDTAKIVCLQSRFADIHEGLSSSTCTTDAPVCTEIPVRSSGTDIEAQIEVLTTITDNVGSSLGVLCQLIDKFLDVSGGNAYDCCADESKNQMRCIRRQFAAGLVTSPGTPGQCLSDDAMCSIDESTDFQKDFLGTLEAKAYSAAISLNSICEAMEYLSNGDLACCSNSQNGQMVCEKKTIAEFMGIDDNVIGTCSSTCNEGK